MKAKELSPLFPSYDKEIKISKAESLGMSPKKIHETSRLASFIIEKAKTHKISKIVDIGAGQGYLSHLLVSASGLSVTAIEGKDHNAQKSVQRAEKINKNIKSSGDFKAICQLITPDNISEIITEPCILIGLHTCGDLASNSLKLFLNSPLIQGVINVGCCYQHLSEYTNDPAILAEYLSQIGESSASKCLDQSFTRDSQAAGFPLSAFVRQSFGEGFFLGKLVRSLCISEPSEASMKDAENNFKKLEYRAAFQSFLSEFFPEFAKTFALGNKMRRFRTFAEYVRLALEKMRLNTELTAEYINTYYEQHFQKHEKKVSIMWALRSVMSGAIENLIICDRILFLQEQQVCPETFSIFDRRLSPRNLVLCGFKS